MSSRRLDNAFAKITFPQSFPIPSTVLLTCSTCVIADSAEICNGFEYPERPLKPRIPPKIIARRSFRLMLSNSVSCVPLPFLAAPSRPFARGQTSNGMYTAGCYCSQGLMGGRPPPLLARRSCGSSSFHLASSFLLSSCSPTNRLLFPTNHVSNSSLTKIKPVSPPVSVSGRDPRQGASAGIPGRGLEHVP